MLVKRPASNYKVYGVKVSEEWHKTTPALPLGMALLAGRGCSSIL
jgi:hypothetical protein